MAAGAGAAGLETVHVLIIEDDPAIAANLYDFLISRFSDGLFTRHTLYTTGLAARAPAWSTPVAEPRIVQDAGGRRFECAISIAMTDGDTTGSHAVLRRTFLHLRPAVLAAVVLCILAIMVACLWWALGEYRDTIRTITEGRVYQSGVLAPDDLRDEVRRLGIRTVIDLREPWEEVKGERAVLLALGVEHVHMPTGHIPEEGTVNRFLDVMSDPATYPVLIHCHHGTGRSVLFSAIYRIEFEGWDRDQARLATRSKLRWLLPGASFAIGAAKGDYLLNYALHRRSAAGASEPARTGQSR